MTFFITAQMTCHHCTFCASLHAKTTFYVQKVFLHKVVNDTIQMTESYTVHNALQARCEGKRRKGR